MRAGLSFGSSRRGLLAALPLVVGLLSGCSGGFGQGIMAGGFGQGTPGGGGGFPSGYTGALPGLRAGAPPLAGLGSNFGATGGPFSTGSGTTGFPGTSTGRTGAPWGGTRSPTTYGTPQGGGGGGLPGGDVFGGAAGPSADPNGVLELPVMKQSQGGSEAAKRGCGPTSLLMATGRDNPREIQGVLVQTCARPGGLIADKAVTWLKSNGYPNSEHFENWTVDMLRQETMVRRNPVIINFRNPRTGNGHIVVVTGVTDQGVHVNDPGPGIKEVHSVSKFQTLWAARNEYAIPVRS